MTDLVLENLSIPGINSILKIFAVQKFSLLNFNQLKKISIAINKANYFITWCKNFETTTANYSRYDGLFQEKVKANTIQIFLPS